jgi:hypothetical protein
MSTLSIIRIISLPRSRQPLGNSRAARQRLAPQLRVLTFCRGSPGFREQKGRGTGVWELGFEFFTSPKILASRHKERDLATRGLGLDSSPVPRSQTPVPRSREWSGPGSNRRHLDFQSSALPTELPNPTTREPKLPRRIYHPKEGPKVCQLAHRRYLKPYAT